jgi:hypothetical protein
MYRAWEKNAYKILVGEHEGRDHLGYLGVDIRIILKCEIRCILNSSCSG